jgi:glycerophosphoryl diester phosphodiesterase
MLRAPALILNLVLAVGLFNGCNSALQPTDIVEVDWTALDSTRSPLSPDEIGRFEGVYDVVDGSGYFGAQVVLRIVDRRACIWSSTDAVYIESGGGLLGDAVSFRGYTRHIRSATAGSVEFGIDPNEGGLYIKGRSSERTIIIRGTYDRDGDRHVLMFRRRGDVRTERAPLVIAHRGGGRNSDRLGVSENSLAMIGRSEKLGATAIEIDIKRTADRQLIVFHDETFSPRTVRGAYVLGPVRNYSLTDIRRYARLVEGEMIPTLDEALRYVVDSTRLQLVWLDVKDNDIADDVIRAQQVAGAYATSKGRDVRFLFGIPTDDVLASYRNARNTGSTPVLCELSVSTALSLPTCVVWAPRWTSDINDADVTMLRQRGIGTFTWTLDMNDYMRAFVERGVFNGILTNYPSMLAGIVGTR